MKTFTLMAFIALLATLFACLLAGAFQHKQSIQTLRLKRGRVRFAPLSTIERAALPFVTGMRLLFGGLTPPGRRAEFFNIAEGVHEEGMSKAADAALTARFLLVKPGSDADHVAVNGAADKPSGIATDEAEEAEDLVNVASLNATDETRKVVASEAIAHGADLYTAASGKVQDEPAVAGTYYRIGKARQAASANNDVIEAEMHDPIMVIVLAAPTVGANIAAFGAATVGADIAAFTDPPSAAEMALLRTFVNALKADNAAQLAELATLRTFVNALKADNAALNTALAAPAEVKRLT